MNTTERQKAEKSMIEPIVACSRDGASFCSDQVCLIISLDITVLNANVIRYEHLLLIRLQLNQVLTQLGHFLVRNEETYIRAFESEPFR